MALWRKQQREPLEQNVDSEFVEIALPASKFNVGSPITVRCADGILIEATAGTDPTWLADLIRRLHGKA